VNKSSNGVNQTTDLGTRSRRQQYRVIARLIKEYTAEIYKIAHHLGEYADGRIPGGLQGNNTPHSVFFASLRFGAIHNEFRSAVLFASQMLVHYDLDEAAATVLRLRIVDAEKALSLAEILNETVFPHTKGKIEASTVPQMPSTRLPPPPWRLNNA
jgi:hypothetical protein